MKGIILAGGKGMRLSPLTLTIPKPLIPVLNVPIIESAIALLKNHGVDEIFITIHQHAEKMIETLGDGSKFGVPIRYVIEPYPLGTAGGLAYIKDLLTDTFIVLSADIICQFDLSSAIHFHKQQGSTLTVISTSVSCPTPYGMILANRDNEIVYFIEKPSESNVFSNLINTGIYIMEPPILSLIPEGQAFDFSKDFFPLLKNKHIALYHYELKGYWADIGQFQSYQEAHHSLLQHHLFQPIPTYHYIEKDVWVGERTFIAPSCTLHGPVVIGNDCTIGENATIYPFTVIGNHCSVGEGCEISDSILWDHVQVERYSHVCHTILASSVEIGADTNILTRTIIAERTKVGSKCVLSGNHIIPPFQEIRDGSIIDNQEASIEPAKVKNAKTPSYRLKYFTRTFVPCSKELKLHVLRRFIEECLSEEMNMAFDKMIQIFEADKRIVTIYPYEDENVILLYSHAENKQICLELARKYEQKLLTHQSNEIIFTKSH